MSVNCELNTEANVNTALSESKTKYPATIDGKFFRVIHEYAVTSKSSATILRRAAVFG